MSDDSAPAPAPAGHNSIDPDGRQALEGCVRSLERLDVEMRRINAARADVFRDAKGMGLEPSIMRLVLARRRLDPAALASRDESVLLYEAAVRDVPRLEDDGTEDATRAARSAPGASPSARSGR